MQTRRLVLGLALSMAWTVSARAQFQQADRQGPRLENTTVEKWRFGIVVTAGAGACRGIVATTSVPTNWPEQQVRVVEERFSPGVRVSYRMVDDAVREMTAQIASLGADERAEAIVTFEIRRSWQVAPDDTEVYTLPDVRKLDRSMRGFLVPSPYIESGHSRIRALAGRIGAGEKSAWKRVEAIYDWVRENVAFEDNRGGRVKGALETLRDGTGDCDEMTSLFIAICRAASIPARTVRVPGHCYPEFYLEDAEGRGHWFPCQAAGTRAFGEMPEHRPVLQKGDNLLLRDPQTKRPARSRFLPDHLTIADAQAPPRFELVLERVPD